MAEDVWHPLTICIPSIFTKALSGSGVRLNELQTTVIPLFRNQNKGAVSPFEHALKMASLTGFFLPRYCLIFRSKIAGWPRTIRAISSEATVQTRPDTPAKSRLSTEG